MNHGLNSLKGLYGGLYRGLLQGLLRGIPEVKTIFSIYRNSDLGSIFSLKAMGFCLADSVTAMQMVGS